MADLLNMIVTDFDGTLFHKADSISDDDMASLRKFADFGFIRVIATGRSMFSLKRAIPYALPIDYIIFSTGAGILDVKSNKLISAYNLETENVALLTKGLIALELDFMLQAELPDNHNFWYWSSSGGNSDFKRRLRLYEDYCKPLEISSLNSVRASQIIVIANPDSGAKVLEIIRRQFSQFNVVRTTSPIDHLSLWIEIFPASVSKGHALERLCTQVGSHPSRALVIGNDYNDLDMLEIAGKAFVVDEAPKSMKLRYEVIPTKSPVTALMNTLDERDRIR